jgi:enamine deaminase RidA (YjgF/YER057c/UK114 family)
MMARRFVPFGSLWSMGIDVPYSLGVCDRGRFWSCGQCPLDLHGKPLHSGDLKRQLRLVAQRISHEFVPHGITPEHIHKLVAYVVPDTFTPLEMVERVLREALEAVPLVLTIGVPYFYYPGMMVEIDVYGSEDAPSSAEIVQLSDEVQATVVECASEIHVRLELDSEADASGLRHALDDLMGRWGSSLDRIVSARLFLNRDITPVPRMEMIAAAMGADTGAVIFSVLPLGQAVVIDLVIALGPTSLGRAAPSPAATVDGVYLVERRAGNMLGLAARCLAPRPTLAGATKTIMEVLSHALAANGLGFADVVKQQTYYVSGASEEDLYENMRVRNSYYERPGPASTGLPVHGFADPDCRITVELLATPLGDRLV